MTISKRDAKLLLILLGIIILLVGYLAVYNPYVNKTEAVEAETSALRPTLEELNGYYQNLDSYYAGIDSAADTMEEELAKYPTDVRPEDLVMYAINLEEKIGADITGIVFSGVDPIMDFQTVSENEDGTYSIRDVSAFRSGMTLSCSLGYQEMKDMLDYLIDTNFRTALDVVSVSFNSETGELIGSASINKYFVAGSDEEYVATQVPTVPIGTDDIFGTFTVSAESGD